MVYLVIHLSSWALSIYLSVRPSVHLSIELI